MLIEIRLNERIVSQWYYEWYMFFELFSNTDWQNWTSRVADGYSDTISNSISIYTIKYPVAHNCEKLLISEPLGLDLPASEIELRLRNWKLFSNEVMFGGDRAADRRGSSRSRYYFTSHSKLQLDIPLRFISHTWWINPAIKFDFTIHNTDVGSSIH